MRRHAGFREVELAEGKLIAAWEHVGHQAVRAALCISHFLCLFCLFFLSLLLLLLFSSFAVLLKCPYPNP